MKPAGEKTRSEQLQQDLLKNIKQTDKFIRENFPDNQPYLYTPEGHAIVFRKKIGFDH